jgi:tetratricopeptide (TPR) repeat protein
MGIFGFFKSNNIKPSIDLTDFKFLSDDHTRIENGRPTMANNKGAWRGIRVKSSDNLTFYVSMYNMNEDHPVWGNNIQMAEKKMKLVAEQNDKIILRGFGTDVTGATFSDYGLTLYKSSGVINKVTLHMHDRNIDIEYHLAKNKSSIDSYSPDEREFGDIQSFLSKLRSMTNEKRIELAALTDYLNNRGVDFYENDDIESAIDYYEKALEIYPINDDALKNLIVCYRETNNRLGQIQAEMKLEYLKANGIR